MLWLLFLRNGKTTDRLLKEAYELSDVPNNRELDVLLSSGEQISISKLSILLNKLGYKSISLTGWQAGIYTSNTNQNAIIESINTERILKELNDRKIVIIAGFQGINSNLDITTLGRGGSDTTAVAVSAALNAKHCYIFSDVDGVYTTDPHKIENAKKIENLSYTEMIDIADEGAKVLHNRCIEIGKKFKIPIITKSTFNDKSGSVINDKIEEKSIKSIVKNDDITLVELKSSSKYSVQELEKTYISFIKQKILPIHLVNNSQTSLDVSFLIKNSDINKVKRLLSENLIGLNNLNDLTGLNTIKCSFKHISRIAIIGYGITTDNNIISNIIELVYSKLNSMNIDIFSIDITDTKIIISFKDIICDELLNLLHEKIFLHN